MNSRQSSESEYETVRSIGVGLGDGAEEGAAFGAGGIDRADADAEEALGEVEGEGAGTTDSLAGS